MRAISLFSGCGGFSEGVSLAGIEVAAAVEVDQYACMTYRANFPTTPLFEGKVEDFLNDDSEVEQIEFDERGIDLVFGGPPCQGFSQIGPRDHSDQRNQLYKEFARVVKRVQPKFFLMENVPNLLLMGKGRFKKEIIEHFRGLGYSDVSFQKVLAADFGVPQKRERVFFFGSRDDITLSKDLDSVVSKFLEFERASEHVTVWQAIGDLPARVVDSGEVTDYPSLPNRAHKFLRSMRLDCTQAPYSKGRKRKRVFKRGQQPVLHNHHTKEMQARRRELISFLEPGAKADSLPKHIWNGARPEKWRRLDPDAPSYTILAQMHRDLSEWVHPKEQRWITVREAARLQSFHDGFVFRGSEWQQLKQVGNAVPPLLAYAMAKAVLQASHEIVDECSDDFDCEKRQAA